jgi:hypothetical protein
MENDKKDKINDCLVQRPLHYIIFSCNSYVPEYYIELLNTFKKIRDKVKEISIWRKKEAILGSY